MSRITYCLSSHKWGGGEYHVIQLLEFFKEKHQLFLITPQNSPAGKQARNLGIEVIHFDFDRSPLKSFPEFIQKILKTEPDLIHSHLNLASWYCSLARPFVNCKILSTIHGYTTPLYYTAPHHLICVSQHLKDSQPSWIRKKASIIYNGVCTPSPIGTSTPQHSSVFATIHSNKGQTFILEALRNSPMQLPLLIKGIGEPAAERKLQNAIENLNGSNRNLVRWAAEVGDLEENWINTAFTIVPSIKEALSYVAIESLSRGIPVLAARTGGLSEVLREGIDGLYFKPGNHRDFESNYLRMQEEFKTFRKKISENPFLKARPQFSLSRMLDDTERLVEKLINE